MNHCCVSFIWVLITNNIHWLEFISNVSLSPGLVNVIFFIVVAVSFPDSLCVAMVSIKNCAFLVIASTSYFPAGI